MMQLTTLSEAQATEAVATFNRLYGEMEKALWCISLHCREPLLQGRSNAVVEALVWTVKSWWGVQGVRNEVRTHMARALATLDWTSEMFARQEPDKGKAAAFACQRVDALVQRTLRFGAARREYSLASKVLHWLMPWRIPVYDSFVKKSLGVPSDWDHPVAYRAVVQREFSLGPKLAAWGDTWLGDVPPQSTLRALDKCLWWLGGGSSESAALVRRPWMVTIDLDLDCGEFGPWWTWPFRDDEDL